MHLRQYNCWSLRCIWSIACRHYSNYIFILDLTSGFNGLHKDNCKMRWQTLKFWDLMRLICLQYIGYFIFRPPLCKGKYGTQSTCTSLSVSSAILIRGMILFGINKKWTGAAGLMSRKARHWEGEKNHNTCTILICWCKKDVTPLLTHWSYVFLALTHRIVCFKSIG